MRVAFAVAVALGSLLLFLIQPMAAKQALPKYGGAAAVWTTCFVFFQTLLLAGYSYAHLLRLASRRVQFWLHGTLLVASAGLVWLYLGKPWDPPPGPPALEITLWMARSLGLAYFLLAANGPLMQYWFAGTLGQSPYRLFALSNAASLAGLVAYPFLLEPWLELSGQFRGWILAYLIFAALAVLLAARSEGRITAEEGGSGSGWPLWLALSVVPSVLWMGVANHISNSVAALPLIWIIPLSLYLLSFVLTFDSDAVYRPEVFRYLMPLALAGLAFGTKQQRMSLGIGLPILILALALLACCVFCHGELARRRPEAGGLTRYYVVIAAGGALGGLFVSVAAPLLFRGYIELPLATVGCVLLTIGVLYGYSSWRTHLRLILVCGAAFLFASRFEDYGVWKNRDFYGTLEVRESGEGSQARRELLHGSVLHGTQFLASERSRLATAYYGRTSGVGIELTKLAAGPRRIGAVGLGVGTLATYLRPEDVIRFYEINPMVLQAATSFFRYLKESAGRVEVVLGDARVSLEREQPQQYDYLILDAFSGDAIPVHLLTREAFGIYLRHLKPEGVLAVHVTNRYLHLTPVVTAAARAVGRRARIVESPPDDDTLVQAATWVIVSGAQTPADEGVWTDRYSNLLQVIR